MILRAGIEYAPVLSKLGTDTFIAAHRESAPAHEIDAYVKEKYTIEHISRELVNPAIIYHIIKHEEAIAGFSKMELDGDQHAVAFKNVSKLDQLYLQQSFHGLKLGASLLAYNIDYSKCCNQQGMWLIVWAGNEKAINFYKKFGFVITAHEQFRLTSTHVSAGYRMFLQYAGTFQQG